MFREAERVRLRDVSSRDSEILDTAKRRGTAQRRFAGPITCRKEKTQVVLNECDVSSNECM